MLIVFADDFSGAAEIGAVGNRFGLSTEIQLDLDPQTNVDLLVVDTNTRSMKEADAVSKLKGLVEDIQRSGLKFRLFKKVDSVMRGHLVAEINILQSIFGFGRIWLLPANPEKGRKIVAGNYEVNGTRLDQTVFATDPDFPMHSSSVDDILKTQSSNLSHCHIDTEGDVPLSGLVTADVSSKADFKKYMKNLQDNDLWCGAASCFEAFLESMGLSENKLAGSAPADKNLHRLIINGSTVKNASEASAFKGLNIPHLSLPGFWEGELFMLDRGTENKWMERVRRLLQSHEIVAVSIDHPVKPLKSISNIFSNHLIKLMHHIIRKFRNKTVHFGLTGGATAYDLISSTGIAKFQVLKEVSPGVVTLRGIGGPEVLFTVKPGSYAWPDDFLK